jgi:hypothetical protein
MGAGRKSILAGIALAAQDEYALQGYAPHLELGLARAGGTK